jgi:hypothetical protein
MTDSIKERWKLIRPLSVPLILYIGSLAFSVRWLRDNPNSDFRFHIIILPIVISIWLAVQILQVVTTLDELGRKILLEGLPFSFILTILLTTSLGLLNLAGAPAINGVFIALFMGISWLIGKLLARRRYL